MSDAKRYAALQDQWRLSLAAKDAEIERLREVVRKLHRLMPGPRGREVLFSPPEADAVRRALGDDAT